MNKRGFTLLEAMIAMAIVAIVATLALPSFGTASERARLKAAAETLSADLSEARFEAARRARPLHVEVSTGAGWCWVVATAENCPCEGAAACRLKATRSRDFNGIELVDARSTRLDPNGAASPSASALFQAPHGEQLRVDLLALGRPRVCTPAGRTPGYPNC